MLSREFMDVVSRMDQDYNKRMRAYSGSLSLRRIKIKFNPPCG